MSVFGFLLLLSFGIFCLLFGFRLAYECADLKADLPDYVNALVMLATGCMLLVAAYNNCPFELVPKAEPKREVRRFVVCAPQCLSYHIATFNKSA